MPLVPKSIPRRPLGAKFGSSLEMFAIIKSDKVDSATKVAPRPTPPAIETDLSAGTEETACMGSCKKSTKSASRKAAEIYVLLKQDLFEDMGACAKFVNDVRGVVCPSSFAKPRLPRRW